MMMEPVVEDGFVNTGGMPSARWWHSELLCQELLQKTSGQRETVQELQGIFVSFYSIHLQYLNRTGKGYFAMSKRQLSKTVQTGMPGGEYTNIIDGSKVTVAGDGTATININNQGFFDKILL